MLPLLLLIIGQVLSSQTVVSPEQAISDDILQNGVMGAVFLLVIGPLALYTWHQTKQLAKLQNLRATEMQVVQTARTADAQAVVDKLLDMNDRWNDSMSEQSKILDSLVEVMKDNKIILQEFRGTLQDVRDAVLEHPNPKRRS